MSKIGWTPERRKRQAEIIRQWKPWEQSTGPKTEAGKEACRMNAKKHGTRGAEWRTWLAVLSAQKESIEEMREEL